jgi:hypothetical protein
MSSFGSPVVGGSGGGISESAGVPSGANAVGDMYVDSTTGILYRCVVAGTGSAAVFVQVPPAPLNIYLQSNFGGL